LEGSLWLTSSKDFSEHYSERQVLIPFQELFSEEPIPLEIANKYSASFPVCCLISIN
jgi:hypothetical protein